MGMRGAFDSYRSAGRAPKWLYNPGSDHGSEIGALKWGLKINYIFNLLRWLTRMT